MSDTDAAHHHDQSRIYTRRSTDEENQPFAFEAQTAKLKSYIKSQDGWILVEEYSDDASGAMIERPNLNRAPLAVRASSSMFCWSTGSTASPAASST
jgi:DNA invertase Pin-like site-specific DNA recombinase